MRGRILRGLGLAAVIGSLAWWIVSVHEALGIPGPHAGLILDEGLTCLVYTTGSCQRAFHALNSFGSLPYSPVMTWVGIVLYLLSYVPAAPQRVRKAPETDAQGAPPKRNRAAPSPSGASKPPWEMAPEG